MPEQRQEDVDIWIAPLEVGDAELAELQADLDGEERARAARFRFDRDRRRFVAAHGFVRRVLAYYLGCDASDVRFRRRPGGKPELEETALRFSLGHAHEIAVCAVASGREVGVDVEYLDATKDLDFLRQALSEHARDERALLTLWTEKEALAKATGEGLGRSLAEIEVGDRWTVRTIDVGPGYVGTVAVEGRGWTIRRVRCETPRLRPLPALPRLGHVGEDRP